MWYLVVNNESERFFFKQISEKRICVISENDMGDDFCCVDYPTIDKFKKENYRLVGKDYNNECNKLEKILKENEVM